MNSRRSENVEDRRGLPVGRLAIGGGGGIIVLLIAMLFGVDPRALLNQTSESVAPQPGATGPPAEDTQAQFVSAVLAETEDVWNAEFQKLGRTYQEPHLVLFTDQVESACGFASAAVGPFYCSSDEKVYLDLGFFDLLEQKLGAQGDFAQAYVIAHEVGHHVQDLLGITEQVHAAQARAGEAERNEISVRLELQADFLAGMWAHHTQRLKQNLDPGDIEEALRAAGAIGDDKLQMESQGYVVPDAFTHGTSEQRVRWFRRGYETGDLSQGDTFRAPAL
jgi:predicted metalloprotease